MVFETNSQANKRFRRNIIPAAIGGCLFALTGCVSGSANDSSNDYIEVTTGNSDSGVRYVYYEDGTRATQSYDRYRILSLVFARCEGKDLIETSGGLKDGAYDRSVDHPSCQDGRLTPEDTEPLPR